MVDFTVLFEGMTIDEMKAALKEITDNGKALIKEKAEIEKSSVIENGKKLVKEGESVAVKYKDGTITGIVTAIREKSFTIETHDVLTATGKPSKIARNFNLVIG